MDSSSLAAHPRPDGYVGVFDSGVGGVSVLRYLVRQLPSERFSYFGDSANAPYGERSVEEVRDLSFAIANHMVGDGAKALVIACNTATSAAVRELRAAYPEIPIVGVEPALKPAVLAAREGKVLVMATKVTLELDKFHRLADRWSKKAQVETVACTGLAARIEQGNLDAPDLLELIERLVGCYRGEVGTVVLGCTHYPFVRRQILQVLGENVAVYDGGEGTARQLSRLLRERGLLAPESSPGSVSFASSLPGEHEIALYRSFFELDE